MPPFSALAAESAGKVAGNDYPVLSSELLDLGAENVILLRKPLIAGDNCIRNALCVISTFGKIQPPLKAPDLGFVRHELAQSVP